MATTRPRSVTGTWRRPWRDINNAASCTLCAASSVCTGCVISSAIGVPIGGCASATRSSRSWRVKMPSAAPASSSTSTEPTRFCCISCSTSDSGVRGAQLTSARRGRLPRRGLHRLLVQRLRGKGRLLRLARQGQHMLHAAVQEVGQHRAARRQLVHCLGRQLQAEAVVDGGIGRAHRPTCQPGGDGEQVTRLQMKAAAGRVRRLRPAGDTAAAQEQQPRHGPVGRLQQGLARRVVALARQQHEGLDIGQGHLRKGREAPQLVAQVLRQAGRRGECARVHAWMRLRDDRSIPTRTGSPCQVGGRSPGSG